MSDRRDELIEYIAVIREWLNVESPSVQEQLERAQAELDSLDAQEERNDG